MMVTFVSQCEKKSLKNTRRVLDAFANRIGSRTWQVVITQEGLKAVKKLLKKNITKNSAVACHWQRSRNRSELVWIVGNRRKFNEEGFVPVNTTEKDILQNHWENDWHYLPLIKSLAALAGLFHDFGKSSDFFQEKLKNNALAGDPLRHEWLSILFIHCLANNEVDNSEWLSRLAAGDISSSSLLEQLSILLKDKKKRNAPLADLPNSAATIAWLILSHHKLPLNIDKCQNYRTKPVNAPKTLFKALNENWGYKNISEDYEQDLSSCLTFSKGLPCDSKRWLKQVQKHASKLIGNLELLQKSIDDGCWRLVLHYSRLSLMLADHYQSSLPEEPTWHNEIDLYANTDRKTGKFKQKLTEHLIRVACQGQRNSHLLPAFEGTRIALPVAHDVKELQKKSPAPFQWQDKPVKKIYQWRDERGKQFKDSQFGFFAVNMASTGKGKTFANAKIMRALSPDRKSLRYILALGLRTLTLQTGDEYQKRIGLDEDEVGILIGSRAVLELHERNTSGALEDKTIATGSESEQNLLENEIIYDTNIPDDHLTTILPDLKHRKFLYAPVLSCTIDHLISATETKRGGRHILPALRLMSSDLVIDEIDDFDGNDLIAIGRLIHLAGMLGRKVMISSATIPPDLAEGYFNAYQAGWALFTKFRNTNNEIGCCWIDEFTTKLETIRCSCDPQGTQEYEKFHQKYIKRRVGELRQQVIKQKGEIWACPPLANEDEEQVKTYFYSTILSAILAKHKQHQNIDLLTGKKVSFGLVRVANIAPCIELTKHLLNAKTPEDTEIRTMAYHSQQLLIMRSAQEKHLDTVLKRKNGTQPSFDQPDIRKHLNGIQAQNVIFVLVATPVEEVGRDHDFDWAVVEPSSYRSIIQLAGRILRHRNISANIEEANIALLQHNLKGLQNKKTPAFCKPGYETETTLLTSHDLHELLAGESFEERLDAEPRISKKKQTTPKSNLVDLEHESVHQLLTNYKETGGASMQGWLSGYWWLTAVPQQLVKFREGFPQTLVYLFPEEGEWSFVEKDWTGKPIPVENQYGIIRDNLSSEEINRLWLYRDYEALLETSGKSSVQKAALIYGEIGLPTYGKESHQLNFTYSNQLGLVVNK